MLPDWPHDNNVCCFIMQQLSEWSGGHTEVIQENLIPIYQVGNQWSVQEEILSYLSLLAPVCMGFLFIKTPNLTVWGGQHWLNTHFYEMCKLHPVLFRVIFVFSCKEHGVWTRYHCMFQSLQLNKPRLKSTDVIHTIRQWKLRFKQQQHNKVIKSNIRKKLFMLILPGPLYKS